MSQHAGFDDIFSAATKLGGAVLDDFDEKKRKELDVFVKDAGYYMDTEINNDVRDNPYNYTGNPDDPAELDKYTKEYLSKRQNNIRAKLAGKFGSRAGMGRYRDAMNHIGTQALEAARDYALKKQDQTRIGNAEIRLNKSIAVYRDTMPPEDAWKACNNAIELFATVKEVSPEIRQKWQADIGRQLYEKAANESLSKVTDVNDLKAAMGALKDKFSFMPPDVVNAFDKDGNLTGTEERPWSYEGKSEWEQKQIKAQTERIQGETFGFQRDRKAYIDRLLASGGNLDYIIEKCREYGADLNTYYNPNNPNYANLSNDQRAMAAGWFDVGKMLEGYKKQGEKGVKTAPIKYYWRQFLSPAIDGSGVNINGEWKTFASLEEAVDDYVNTTRTAFFYGEGLDEYGCNDKGERDEWAWQKWRGLESEEMKDFYNVLEDVLKDKDPNLLTTFHRFRDKTIFTKKESPFYSSIMKDLSDTEQTAQAQRYISYFNTMFFRDRITDVATIEKRMEKLIEVDMARLLFDRPTQREPGAQLMQEAEISRILMSERADELLFVDYDPEKNSLMGDGRKPGLIWLDPKDEEIAERQRQTEFKRVSDMLGIAMSSFGPPRWMPSSRHKGDVIPKGMFTVTSKFISEDVKGTYYLDYDEKANPIVYKQNASGGWDVYKKEERQLTQGETIQLNIRTTEDYKKAIRSGKNPKTGEDFDYSVPPPGSSITKAQWNNQSYINQYRIEKDTLWANFFMQEQGAR